jgi:DNA-binding HxlR family transcriptional regulator
MKGHSKAVCPVAKVADLLSDTWTMLIVRDIMRRPMRFSELCQSLEGISTRTLTLKLEKLTQSGIILKKEPYYAISKKGTNLGNIFGEMTKYGKKYLA